MADQEQTAAGDPALAPGGALVIEEEDPLNLPPHGTEVFVGGIHRSTTDEQLREFASEAGEVYSIKLVRDPSNPAQNRGYAFVKFATKEAALIAMDRLAARELTDYPGHKVRT